MKKKFMIAAAIAALTLVGVYLGKAATDQTGGLSDLELANAEALAQVEAYSIPCLPADDRECVFPIVLPDGTKATLTVGEMKHILD